MSRALNAKSKLDLLKECLKHADLFDENAKRCITDCFSEVEQCRIYRNAIIHHHIYDHEKGIGSYLDHSHSPHQILVSLDALTNLYKILCSLLDELQEIDLLFRIETDAQKPGTLNKATHEFNVFDNEKLRKKIIPLHTKRIMAMQNTRKNMQKLPIYPDADLVRSLNKIDDIGID